MSVCVCVCVIRIYSFSSVSRSPRMQLYTQHITQRVKLMFQLRVIRGWGTDENGQRQLMYVEIESMENTCFRAQQPNCTQVIYLVGGGYGGLLHRS